MEFRPTSDSNHNIMPTNSSSTSLLKDDDSPLQQINEQSIAEELEKNRESLKRKLQTRRSLKQLVDVGIMPSPKAPVPFYEQQKKLQMRRTQDMLKNKIISRPDRQLLIEHNILSDTIAAPAIQKTQRQLKRARLADNLNDKIAARPGVLELIASNILEIDSNLKEAIQGGRIPFPSTKSSSPTVLSISRSCSSEDLLATSITPFSHQPRPLRPKTSSSSNTTSGQNNSSTSKRLVNSNSKIKSSLTFHEYKGPSQKVEVTKVPLQPTRSLIVQPVQATLVPLAPLDAHSTLSDSQYRIRLQQQKLFLELQNTNNNVKFGDIDQSNDSSDLDPDDNPIGNLLKQPIDESVHILTNISEEIRSFEKMKLVDLRNHCRKLNLSTTGTKTKLIEKLRNAAVKLSDNTLASTSMNNIDSTTNSLLHSSSPSVQLLMSSSSLSDQELYQQQQQKIVELENQLEKLKQLDPYGPHSSSVASQFDSNTTIPQKCNPMVSVQIQKRVLLQQQEKLKQKMQDEQQQQQLLQQHPIVPLTPESVVRFLANQSQSYPLEMPTWSIHHSTSAPSFLSYSDAPAYPTSSNDLGTKLTDEEAIFSLLDDYTDTNSALSFSLDHSLGNPTSSCVTSTQMMDWMPISSPTMLADFSYDNNSEFSQFFNQVGNEHHLLFDQPLSMCQQSSNTHSFDLFSPSSPMI